MNLPNPLDAFQSYSVHHIILAARSTEDALPFCDDSAGARILDAVGQTKLLGDPVNYNSIKDKVFLVLDTRRFSQFTIENLRYDVLVNGLLAEQSPANFATDLSMTVIDSVGISFINFMQWLFDVKLKTNADGTLFVLKTVFIGHNPDGSTETVHTTTVPMHLASMTLSLDHVKGAYVCGFFPNANFNIDNQRRWFQIGQASNYFTGEGVNKLGPLVASVESSLNKRSSEYFEKVQAHAKKTGGAGANFGRQVKYMITIPQKWHEFTVNGSSEGGSTETVFKRIAKNIDKKQQDENQKAAEQNKPATGEDRKVTDTYLSVDSGILITDVLDILFSQIHEIKKMGNFQQSSEEDGFVTFYKFITSLTSDNDTVTVHVDVVEFVVPNKLSETKKVNAISKNESSLYRTHNNKKVPQNFVEFDYIFTGKNKDILSLDLKIENLEMLLLSNISVSSGKYFQTSDGGKIPDDKSKNPAPEIGIRKQFDPILMPISSAQEDKNFSDYSMPEKSEKVSEFIATSQEYSRNLSNFYSASPITMAMTIKGNPHLLTKFNIGTVMSNIQNTTNLSKNGANSSSNSEATSAYRKDLEERVLQQFPTGSKLKEGSVSVNLPITKETYTTAPVFIKLNIKGPNVDFRTNELINEEQFASEALMDIYFTVFKITHIFENSSFTQDFELYSHNIQDADIANNASIREVK